MLEAVFNNVSPATAAIAAAVLLTAYIVVGWILEERNIQKLGGHAPAVPSWWPLGVDIIWDSIQHAARHENLQFWDTMFMTHGHAKSPYTTEARPGGKRVIFTADPENIKAVLATQFHDFGKGKRFNQDWHEFLGDSIFATDQEKWHQSRQLIRPQFVRDRVSDLHTFEKHVVAMMPLLGGQGQPVDVKDLFFRFTLDAATDFLLGRSIDSLHNSQSGFAHAFAEVQRIQNLIARAGPMNFVIPRVKFRRHLKTLNNFVEPYIADTLALSQDELEKRTKSDHGYTFLHALASYTRDRKVLRDQLVAVLLAGRDTTACTLSWLFYEISRNPAIVAKLRKEIGDVVGWHDAPTYAHLKGMRYLQHILNETLRLYPVVPFNVRVSLKDTTLPHGGGTDGLSPVGIPAGTPIGYSTHYMQLTRDIYPPTSADFTHPLIFDPDRWDTWQPRMWTYIPFNGGPRICVGQQFALTEMGYVVVRILQRFARVEDRTPGPGIGVKINQSGGAVSEKERERFYGHGAEESKAGISMPRQFGDERQLKMKSEIVLIPADEVLVAFYED